MKMVKKIIVVYVAMLLWMLSSISEADWTPYFDLDNSDYEGDIETITEVSAAYPRFMCKDPVRLQAKTDNGVPAHQTGEVFSEYSIEKGFACLNRNQSDKLCENYQIRFCCPGGHGVKWCLTDEELKQIPMKKIYASNIIPENTKIGGDVWKIPFDDILGTEGYLYNVIITSVEIVSGNKNNRFCVSENNSVVILAGLLDADILSRYSLVLHLTFVNGSVLAIQLITEVTDVDGWPLTYNSTCEVKPSSRSRGPADLPIALKVPELSDSRMPVEGTMYVFLNNTECNVEVLSLMKRKVLGYDIQQFAFQLIFEEGSNTFQAEFEVLKDDDPRIEYLGHEYNKTERSPTRLVLWGINTHGSTRFDAEVFEKGSGKLLYGLYTPFELVVIDCPQSRYGSRCQYKCDCKNGASCHMWNGACKCRDGWQGPACDIPMKAIATLKLQAKVKDPTPVFSDLQLFCSVTNVIVKNVVWKFNKTIVEEASDRIAWQTFMFDSLYALFIKNLTREDSGVYKCIAYGLGDTAESNEFTLRVEGCKSNMWGENCDRFCDCINAVSCLQNKGCVCKEGWGGKECHLDIQEPEIHDCPDNIKVQSGSDGTAIVSWNVPNVTDNAGPPSIISNYISGDVFYIGKTAVVFNVSDGVNHVYCSFSVRVIDVESPQIRCPPDMKFYTEANNGYAVVNWTLPTVSDNSKHLKLSSSHSPGEKLSTGNYIIVYNASDPSGNTDNCSFQISVLGAPSTKRWLIALLSTTAGILSIAACIAVYLTYRKKRPRNHLYVPLDDVLSLPEAIPKLHIKNLMMLQQIGQGEFSQVKSGKLYNDDENAQDVAIKIMKDNNMEAQYIFREECERLNDLRGYENIIQLIGVVMEPNKKYIVTELMASDLLNILTELNITGVVNIINDRRFVKYSLGIARALEHMEQMKIVHRDIAARNILISHEDVAKVGDFGFARDVYQTGEYHRHQGRPGRFPTRWMAPESLQDGIYTYKSDIWSYGILLWEIANLGSPPKYPNADYVNVKTLHERLLQGYRLPRSPDCSNEIFRLMSRCWYTRASERSSANAIVEELSQYINAERGYFHQYAE